MAKYYEDHKQHIEHQERVGSLDNNIKLLREGNDLCDNACNGMIYK